MEKRKEEFKERTRIKRMRWRKERKNQGKNKDKQNGIEKRKGEYEEKTRIQE